MSSRAPSLTLNTLNWRSETSLALPQIVLTRCTVLVQWCVSVWKCVQCSSRTSSRGMVFLTLHAQACLANEWQQDLCPCAFEGHFPPLTARLDWLTSFKVIPFCWQSGGNIHTQRHRSLGYIGCTALLTDEVLNLGRGLHPWRLRHCAFWRRLRGGGS